MCIHLFCSCFEWIQFVCVCVCITGSIKRKLIASRNYFLSVHFEMIGANSKSLAYPFLLCARWYGNGGMNSSLFTWFLMPCATHPMYVYYLVCLSLPAFSSVFIIKHEVIHQVIYVRTAHTLMTIDAHVLAHDFWRLW